MIKNASLSISSVVAALLTLSIVGAITAFWIWDTQGHKQDASIFSGFLSVASKKGIGL
jgi:hypothetical protein